MILQGIVYKLPVYILGQWSRETIKTDIAKALDFYCNSVTEEQRREFNSCPQYLPEGDRFELADLLDCKSLDAIIKDDGKCTIIYAIRLILLHFPLSQSFGLISLS